MRSALKLSGLLVLAAVRAAHLAVGVLVPPGSRADHPGKFQGTTRDAAADDVQLDFAMERGRGAWAASNHHRHNRGQPMLLRGLIAAALLMPAFHQAHAETLVCTEISSIPATIATPGHYCLAKNLSTNQAGGGGILIKAHYVKLDCNGHMISNGNAANEDVGIASNGNTGVTVENCRIKGFQEGIHFDVRSYDLTIRNNVIASAKTYGILAWGSKVRIEDNTLLDTRYVSDVRDYNQAIYVAPYEPGNPSRDIVVRGNRVLGLSGTLNMQAIRVQMAIAPLIQNNHVGGMSPKAGGNAYAIMLDSTTNAVVTGNTLTGVGSANTTGVSSDSTSLCANNIIIGLKTSGLQWCGLQQGNLVKQ
jgi:hypothetical protein